MFQRNILGVVLILTCFLVPAALAGKMEQATRYPSPQGEYSEIQAVNKLKVPLKDVNGSTSNLTRGEIWVEV